MAQPLTDAEEDPAQSRHSSAVDPAWRHVRKRTPHSCRTEIHPISKTRRRPSADTCGSSCAKRCSLGIVGQGREGCSAVEISRLKISNFRSIKEADIQFGAVTVLIGTNNAGKSAILEAIRIALTRRWGQRGTGFTEYDVHLCDGRPDPKVGDPVVIEVEFQEAVANEWPEDLHGELEDIIQLDPVTGRASIIMRVSCSWEAAEESFVPRWEFLNVERNPLAGRGARAVNLQEFFQFLPVFYLEALRDVTDEFSSRSQFWPAARQ